MKNSHFLINVIVIFILANCTVQTPQPTMINTIAISPTSVATTIAVTATSVSAPTGIKDLSAYHLSPQTADKAQEILIRAERAILDAYNHLETPLSQYTPYYQAAEYSALDALLHFPNDKRAETWRWKMAYYAALGGDGDLATNIYSELITQALNDKKKMSAANLPSWFQSGELESQFYTPIFKLEMQPVKLSTKDIAYLVQLGELEGTDTPGSICLLLIEKEQKYATFLLYNGFPSDGYFPTLRNPTDCKLKDLTNDGIDEVIADNWYGGHVGTTTIQVFDLSSLPPKVMPFNSSKDEKLTIWNGGITGYPDSGGKAQIQTDQPIGQCDSYITRDYQWTGKWFDSKNATFVKGSDNNFLEYCGSQIAYISNELNTQNAVQILDQVLQTYTPASDHDREILEELRIQKGLLYIFNGEQDKARSVLQETVQSPIVKNGLWVKPVQDFLATYNGKSNLYQACSALTACDPYSAESIGGPNPPACVNIHPCDTTQTINFIVTNDFASKPLNQLINNLRNAGVEIASEGWIDMDSDGKNELWFTVMPPEGNDFQFWIASGYPKGIKTFNLDNTPSPQPDFDFIKTLSNSKHTLIDFRDGKILDWMRDPITEEPVLGWLYETIEEEKLKPDIENFRQWQYELYKGNNPKDIYEKMLDMKYRYGSCPFEIRDEYNSITTYYDCTAYYYTIGLAAELSGEEDSAVEMYYTILKLYSNRPLALLAQSKLDQ